MENNKPIVSVNIMGGLGNQLFQVASAYAYSKKNNGKLQIVKYKKENDGRPLYWDSVLSKFDKYLVDSVPSTLLHWREKGATEFCQIPQLPKQGLYLNGYLQSSHYFNNFKDDIRELLKPSNEILEIINTKYAELMKNKDRVIVVHARRTDYCKNQHMINFHGPLPIDYYKNAIQQMCQTINNPIFLLVGDDYQFWVDMLDKIPEFNKENIYILETENEINTFALLQQFHYFIMSNSTYIWWSVWLAKDAKRVIAPSKWFGPIGPQNYKDIYESSWELM
jgi:hypothetical protein